MTHLNPVFGKTTAFALAALLLTFTFSNLAIAQDASVKAVKDAGGRVSQISAAGPETEVNFSLSSKDVTDSVLPEVAKMKNVIWLNLRATKITDGGLKAISGMTGLTRLHLEKTKIGDEGLKHLAKLENLTYLNLYGTQVTDAGLANLSGLKKLKNVYVWQSKVSEEGIKKFKAAHPKVKIVGELNLTPPKVVEEGKKGDAKKKAEKKKDKNKK